MGSRQAVVVGVALLLGCFIGGFCVDRLAAALGQRERIPPPAPLTVGRYQAVGLPGRGSADSWVVVDTGTGQCWRVNAAGDGAWKDFGSPVPVRR